MNPLNQEVLALAKNSPTLQAQPELLEFWLGQIPELNGEGLLKVKAVLEADLMRRKEIEEASLGRIVEIEKQHLEALEHFKRVDLPKFLKKWEVEQASKDNPEELLNQL